jgi:uncharacterized protein YndB with AHSA1/START domain
MAAVPVNELIVVNIEAPPEVVWEFRIDSENLPRMNAEVSNVNRLDAGDHPARAGARYICEIDFDAGPLLSTVDVVEAEPAKRIVIEMESWPFSSDGLRPSPAPNTGLRAREDARFRETPSGGTCVELQLTMWPREDVDSARVEQLRSASVASITRELEGVRAILEQA